MHAHEAVVRLEPAVRRWFARRVPGHEDAEDLTQEVMVTIIRSWSRIRERSRVDAWVFGICRNVLANHRRAAAYRRSLPLDEEVASAPPDDEWTKILVNLAVRTLPPRLQSIYNLRFREGLRVGEIAQRLGRPEGTIKYQLYEIRERLSRLLGDDAVAREPRAPAGDDVAGG